MVRKEELGCKHDENRKASIGVVGGAKGCGKRDGRSWKGTGLKRKEGS